MDMETMNMHEIFSKMNLLRPNYNFLLRFSSKVCLLLCIAFVVLVTFTINLSPFSFSFSSYYSEVKPGPTSPEHLVFGLGGSAKTWKDRRDYTRLWWVPNITRGYIWLDQDPHLPQLTYPPYRVTAQSGLTRKSSDRLARILKESFQLGLPNVRWFVMGDDDTIFFVDNLVSVLSKYDHRQMYYIGSNSESLRQNMLHGFHTAFGGGGFAVSYALACELVQILDGCIERYHKFYGSDQKVSTCILELGVPLTREAGFHQVDVRGDPYGLLAAHPVTPLVSLHHLDYLQPLFPGQTRINSVKRLMQAYHSDPGLTMQQSFCYDHKFNWSLSLSWGYTAQLYPFRVSSSDLRMNLQTFTAWVGDGSFAFNTRPVNADPCGRPIIYYLDQVESASYLRKTTKTVYKRGVAAETGVKCNQTAYMNAMSVKQITVSALKTDPGMWTKAPRRRCCEITDNLAKNGEIRLMIRGCQPIEATNI